MRSLPVSVGLVRCRAPSAVHDRGKVVAALPTRGRAGRDCLAAIAGGFPCAAICRRLQCRAAEPLITFR